MMYHHHHHQHQHQHQAKNIHSSSSSRMAIPPERHLFLQPETCPEDSGLVLSTDAKPRLKWTPDLHERFIEAVNQLQSVLEKAQETLGRQNLGTVGLEAAKVQLSELVSKVSTQCLNSAFTELKEVQGSCPQNQPTDCSVDSCLTSCEGSKKDQEIQNNSRMGLRAYNSSRVLMESEETILHLKENNMFVSALTKNADQRMFPSEARSGDLSMSIGLEREKWNRSNCNSEERFKARNTDDSFLEHTNNKAASVKVDQTQKVSQGYSVPYFAAKLDLNSHDDIDASSSCKQFDLNGFSWS